MADRFVINPGAINRIAKSSEIQQLVLGGAQGIASAAASMAPEGHYSADVVVGQTRARARVKATPPDISDGWHERQEWLQNVPIFRIQPRFRS